MLAAMVMKFVWSAGIFGYDPRTRESSLRPSHSCCPAPDDFVRQWVILYARNYSHEFMLYARNYFYEAILYVRNYSHA